jgi:ACS family tartrate transporter-like MFS transporter
MSDDRVFAKCAWRLIPFMVLLYVVNYLDRVNVGFAALTMNKDLGFSPAIYGFGAGLFFVGYLLFQVPTSIVLERVGVRRSIFCILTIWGAISAATALVRGPASFYAARFFLGAAEAGFFPVMMLYLSSWFPRSYRTRFTATFMAAIPLSSVIGGPISGLILGMQGLAGLAGWQWLFLVEGLPAVILGFAVLRFLPDNPARVSWLTAEEKEMISARHAAEDIAHHRDVWPALRDPRVLALGLVNFGLLFGAYGVQLWLPQIVQAMGFSNLEIGFIAALPYVVSLPAMILWGRSSDFRDERVWHVALPALFAAAAFIVASIAQSSLLALVAISLASVGLSAMQPPFFSLLSSFLSGPAAAGGIALVLSISNVGSFLGPSLVGVLKEQTGSYAGGMAVFAVALVLAAVIVLAVGRAIAPRTEIFPSSNAGRGLGVGGGAE